MQIVILVSSLAKGGAERVAANLAVSLKEQGHAVTVVTKDKSNGDDYDLSPEISRKRLPKLNAKRYSINRLLAIKKRNTMLRDTVVDCKPDVVISFTTIMNVRILRALRHTAIPVVISEHNNPFHSNTGWRWRVLRRCMYHRAACLVSVSQGIDAAFHWLPENKRAVIYNSVPKAILHSANQSPEILLHKDRHWMVAVGRLVPAKGFDILLKAFSATAADMDNWNLVIMGEGPERDALEKLIERLGLQDRVLLPGRLQNPFPVLKQADYFVLTSRYEGFGNVIVESMTLGLPVISVDCEYGPAEILTAEEQGGLLIPQGNTPALEAAMIRLAQDPNLRKSLAAAAKTRAKRFSADTIARDWQQQLLNVVS